MSPELISLGYALIGGLITAAVSWGTVKTEMRNLKDWMRSHDEQDERRFAAQDVRIDNILLQRGHES